ncbi:hypothetical protein HA402_008257, partial [Bradysia odoriphaga]
KISGIYSVTKTNHPLVFSSCEVHGLSQLVNGDIDDRFVKDGSACPSVYTNLITKTSTAFQFAFSNNDTNCMPRAEHRSFDNMKMKVAADGTCFLKAFCLPNGTSVINLLCKKPGLLGGLLETVVNILLALLGSAKDSLISVTQSCYNNIIGNPDKLELLL